MRAAVIGALICHGVIDTAAVQRHYGIDFAAYFAGALLQLEPLAADGLVRTAHGEIAATATGRLLLRNFAMCFDRYLAAAPLSRAV